MSGVSEKSRTHQRAELVSREQHDRAGFAGAKSSTSGLPMSAELANRR